MEETNLPVPTKNFWSCLRVLFFMIRKSISKRKLMLDLSFNMMVKRGKIAGKAIHNLMFHHNSSMPHGGELAAKEYEFSCRNTPAFPFHLGGNKRTCTHFFPCAHAPATSDDDDAVIDAPTAAMRKVLEMMNSEASPAFWQSPAVWDMIRSELSSPALPGFGRTPSTRQLRITDSPFPLRGMDEDADIDKAAEDFILRFYNELRQQNNGV
ncbi:hypothetical protein NMG60_11005071 [Bertholletia excelsa]